MKFPGPLLIGVIHEVGGDGGTIKLHSQGEVRFYLKSRGHLEISRGEDRHLLLKHGLNGSQQTSEPARHEKVICLLAKDNRNLAYRWAIVGDYSEVIEAWRTIKEKKVLPTEVRKELRNLEAIQQVSPEKNQKVISTPHPKGLQKAIVVDMNRERGLGHAKMGSGLTVCIEISKFRETIVTGYSDKPYDVGERVNCPAIKIGDKIIFYFPEHDPPGRKHPRPTRWSLAQTGDRQRKPRYRNHTGQCNGKNGCLSQRKPTARTR